MFVMLESTPWQCGIWHLFVLSSVCGPWAHGLFTSALASVQLSTPLSYRNRHWTLVSGELCWPRCPGTFPSAFRRSSIIDNRQCLGSRTCPIHATRSLSPTASWPNNVLQARAFPCLRHRRHSTQAGLCPATCTSGIVAHRPQGGLCPAICTSGIVAR